LHRVDSLRKKNHQENEILSIKLASERTIRILGSIKTFQMIFGCARHMNS